MSNDENGFEGVAVSHLDEVYERARLQSQCRQAALERLQRENLNALEDHFRQQLDEIHEQARLQGQRHQTEFERLRREHEKLMQPDPWFRKQVVGVLIGICVMLLILVVIYG